MMKTETIYPLNVELCINEKQIRRIEQICLTANQYEVLEIVTRILDQTISEYLTETVLSMLECELEDTITWELQKKLERSDECKGTGIAIAKTNRAK
jgi:hypothetical protein